MCIRDSYKSNIRKLKYINFLTSRIISGAVKSRYELTELEFLFVCLFVCGLLSHSRIFLTWRHHHYRWRAANFDLCSWPLSSEGSFACHTYCDTGHPFIMIISEDLCHWHAMPINSGGVTTCLNDLGLSRLGFKHPTFRLRGERSNLLRHSGDPDNWLWC